jgi:hypothetical protein
LNIFQFTSAVLFFTNSVISAHEAFSLIDIIGKNSTINVSHDTKPIGNQTVDCLKHTDCKPTIPFFGVCCGLSKKLFKITKHWKTGSTSESNCAFNVGEALHTDWELWKKEIAEVTEKICTAFGVKHWSQISVAQHARIREVAGTVIAERQFFF